MDENKSKKSRILIISDVFYPEIGSGANRITNLMLELKTKGYKVDILTSEPSYPNKQMYKDKAYTDSEKEQALERGSNIIRVKSSNKKPTTNFLNRLYIYIHFLIASIYKVLTLKTDYDLIIASIPSPFSALIGWVAKRRFRCNYLLDIRDLWPECIKNIGLFRKNKFALKLAYIYENIILKATDSIIINSEAFRVYLLKKGYKNEIIFVPNGLLYEEIKEFKKISKKVKKHEKFTIIYTGMIGLPQNVTSIVRVANHLRKFEKIEFKIIGTGIQKQKVLELIEHYNLSNINVYGPMPKKEIIKEVAKCHVAMAHLRKDSAFDLVIPGKVIDYMGIGIPIVAGVEGYTKNIVINSKAGVSTEPDDYKAMADALLHIYLQPRLIKFYGKKGQDYCRKNYCWESNINNYIKVVEKMMRRNKDGKKSMHVCVESLYK